VLAFILTELRYVEAVRLLLKNQIMRNKGRENVPLARAKLTVRKNVALIAISLYIMWPYRDQ